MEIRDARPEEIEEISALLVAAYAEYIPSDPDDAWLEYQADIADVRGRWDDSEQIVAADGHRIVGSVTYYPQTTGVPDARDRWPEGWSSIRLLATLPSERGRGIGRLLTDECIARARRRGAPAVGLHTTDFMKVAKAMYERMGFVRMPDKDFVPSPDVTVIGYRLDL